MHDISKNLQEKQHFPIQKKCGERGHIGHSNQREKWEKIQKWKEQGICINTEWAKIGLL